jgi:hypothetical protein
VVKMPELTCGQVIDQIEGLRVRQMTIAKLFDDCDLNDYMAIFDDFYKVTMRIKELREWLEMEELQNA